MDVLCVMVTLESKRKSTRAAGTRVDYAKTFKRVKRGGGAKKLTSYVPQGGAFDVVTKRVISTVAAKNAATFHWFMHAVGSGPPPHEGLEKAHLGVWCDFIKTRN